MAQGEATRKRSGGGTTSGPRATREIPDKLYFRIGEVAQLCEVPAYVLRFWEGEFPQLKPNKGGTGQRLYRRRDVEMALRIKTLLYDEGYTIPGARQAFKAEARTKSPDASVEGTGAARAVATQVDTGPLEALRKELRDLHVLLSKPAMARGAMSAVQPIRTAKAVPAKAALPQPVMFPTRPSLVKKQALEDEPGLFDDLFPGA